METSDIFLSTLVGQFEDLTSLPLPFLQGQSQSFDGLKQQCKDIYDFTKSVRNSTLPDPLPKLLIDNFDAEQVWGQIELFNKKEAAVCLKAADVLTAGEADITFSEMPKSDHEKDISDDDLPDLDIREGGEFTAEMVSSGEGEFLDLMKDIP